MDPLLWNIMHNDVVNFAITEEATVADYVDDIALVVVGKNLKNAKIYSCEAISAT